MKEKILLVLHIRSLEDSALAKMMWREQLENNWSGPVMEAIELFKKIGVEYVDITVLDKAKNTKLVEEACRAKDEAEKVGKRTVKVAGLSLSGW